MLLTLILCPLVLLMAGNLFAGDPVVVDHTGTDFQSYWYVGTYGKQITVDDAGKVHIAYAKTWATAGADTGYQVMYANVTDEKILEIPSQNETAPVQPGIVFIGGGKGDTPVFMYYGVGGRMYSYADDMHLQAMAKLAADGNSITPLGMQEDKNYYHNPYYANPIAMDVDNVNGIAHCILTNPGGAEVAYWNFDGTTFGEIYNLIWSDAASEVPGKQVAGKFRRHATKGADLAVNSDGSEVTVATLHPQCNIYLHKGSFGGQIWADDFIVGLTDGSVVAFYDTTNSATGENIPNEHPKPYTDIQVVYDASDNLHVVWDAAYVDIHADTSTSLLAWYGNDSWFHSFCSPAGDAEAVFYDGSVHAKPQLRYWNDITETEATLAEATYPLAGQKLEWFSYGVPDSGMGTWGKYVNDGLIANVELIANMDPAEGEPLAVVVWEEMMDVVPIEDAEGTFYGRTYYAAYADLMVSSFDGASWSAPYNITQTAELDERDVSVYNDVMGNKIHMMYYQDNMPGCDRNMVYVDDAAYTDRFVNWVKPGTGGHFSIPIRTAEADLVNVMYQEVDLTMTSIDNEVVSNPVSFKLAQNFPNPFNPTTSIAYTVPAGQVNLTIYNLLGQKVRTLVNKDVPAGVYEAVWDGADAAGNQVASGVYFYKLKSEAGELSKKMLLQR
jgi:hypothetical protein